MQTTQEELETNGKYTLEEIQKVRKLFDRYPIGGADGK